MAVMFYAKPNWLAQTKSHDPGKLSGPIRAPERMHISLLQPGLFNFATLKDLGDFMLPTFPGEYAL